MNVAVRSFPLLILGVAGLLMTTQSHAQTSVATNPVGYNMLTLPHGNIFKVNTFVQPTAFQGIAASITSSSNSVVTLSGTGTPLVSGSFNALAGGPAYYLEVLSSGSAQGLIVDVLANSGTTITVNANLQNFAVSGTTSFCVRPHTTLSSLFPANCGLTGYSDTIKLFLYDGSNQTYTFTGTGDGWIDENFVDAGSVVIHPGEGFLMAVQTAKTIPIMGTVKAGPTQVPLYPGVNNVVGTINPVLSGSQTLSSYNLVPVFTPYADSAKLFSDDGQLTSTNSYSSNGTNMIDENLTDADSVTVNPSDAILINVQQGKLWTMPSFYTSGN